MIRTIDCKIKKIIKFLLVLVFCFSWTINSSFLSLQAQSTNHGHQTITGGRLEWELNTYDAVQDIEVNGTTFRAAGIMIFNYYLTNTSKGTIRLYWTGFNSGWYNAMNLYTDGATISNVVYSGSAGITFKINEPTDRITVIMTFNNTDMNQSISNLTTFSNVTSLTTITDNTQSTLTDIDVKLSGIDLSLQDIITILQNDNASIINYLDQINAYSAYLEDIKLDLDNIDNTIDTISWNSIPITFKGWTSNFSTYVTTNSSHNGGYYCFDGFSEYLSEYTGNIFKMNVPVYFNTNFTLTVGLYYGGPRGSTNITINDYVYIKHGNYMTLFFILDPAATSNIYPQYSTFYLQFGGPPSTTYNGNYPLDCSIIKPDDIEYWTIRNTIKQERIVNALESLTTGSNETQTTSGIDSITSDLNNQIQDSNQAQQSIDNMLDDFNLTFDLDNYRFSFDNNAFYYFKQKLTDLYDINQIKPFYIIPLVLFIVWRLLSG